MAIQLSTAVRDARANAVETTIGTAPILRIYDLTGAAPANCAASISGIATLLAEMTLPSDWLGASSSGAKAIAGGPWSDASANGTGTADFFRIWDAAGTTCHLQGTVGQGTGDLQLVNTSITATSTHGSSTAGESKNHCSGWAPSAPHTAPMAA